MKLGATEYQTVQQIYRGWELFGVVVLGALASTIALTISLRSHPTAFTPALVAFLCIAGTQLVFWTFTFPVNRGSLSMADNNMTAMSRDRTGIRVRSHKDPAIFERAGVPDDTQVCWH
jgi:hypothetical protein